MATNLQQEFLEVLLEIITLDPSKGNGVDSALVHLLFADAHVSSAASARGMQRALGVESHVLLVDVVLRFPFAQLQVAKFAAHLVAGPHVVEAVARQVHAAFQGVHCAPKGRLLDCRSQQRRQPIGLVPINTNFLTLFILALNYKCPLNFF